MAALVSHDVVKEAQSVGAQSLTGDFATTSDSASAAGGLESEPRTNPADPTLENATSSDTAAPAFGESVVNGPSRDLSRSPFNKEALADASGGSDTDTSKTDGLTSKEDASGHIRTNSFKKPISFKSVSVTKNFLAKANVPSSGARPGEKGGLGGQSSVGSTLKPRLVAKSALGGLSSRGSLISVGSSTNSPDASKVWNKNRPPPPPVPRNYTDEELKQQYGIHMATRLGADEDGKEAKWADIDDDEDDWAPEPVTWLDGTKSTVAPVEAKPVEAAQTPQPKLPQQANIAGPGERPRLQLQKQSQPPTSPGPETILSDSPHPKTPALASTKTILKPGSHVLAQKAAANTVKPTEKQTPVVVGSPAPVPARSPWAPLPPVDKASPVSFVPPPPPQQRPRDYPLAENYQQATPLSPQEIEADDFHRFHNQSRRKELFNSQSGEFEPANDARRHSARHEQHGHRQPAVLQRGPSNHIGAAEPSPSSPQWQRQRTGSIDSSGRRMSSSRPHDLAKPDLVAEASGAAIDAQQLLSDSQPEPDAAAFMREQIEKARVAKQKRMQEEEQEEKARKERLRLKMAALAPATPSPSAEDMEQGKSAKPEVVKSPRLVKAIQAVASPPKPPVPTAKGEVAQYGLMKVHQSQPVKNAAIIDQQASRGNADQRLQRRPSVHSENVPKKVDSGTNPIAAASDASHQTTEQFRPSPVPESSPWRATGPPPEGINGWGSSNPANVWGPPGSKAKALGNGTFDNSGFRSLQGGAQGQRAADPTAAFNGPGPIGPPSGQSAAHTGRAIPAHVERAHGPHGEISPPNSLGHVDTQNFGASPKRGYPQSLRNDRASSDELAVGGPVRHPSSAHDPAKATAVSSAWKALIIPSEESPHGRRDWQQQANFDITALDRPVTPIYVKIGQPDTRRAVIGMDNSQQPPNDRSANGNVIIPGHMGMSPQGLGGRVASTLVIGPPQSNTNLTQKPSRFFPRSEIEAVQQVEDSDSPPPPEISSLDNGAGLQSPRVHLPRVAVVKLPPAMLAPTTPQRHSAAASPGLVSSNTRGDWQSRFNTLFKADTSSAGAVATSTRAPLDHGPTAAAVSLPTRSKPALRPIFSTDKSANTQTRKLDEDLYPQPEFGSTPTIRLPSRDRASKPYERFQISYKSFNPLFLQRLRESEVNLAHSQPLWEQFEAVAASRLSYIVKLTKDATPKVVNATSGVPRAFSSREGIKERRSNLDNPIGTRGGRRGGMYASRGSGTGFLRGHTARSGYRPAANAAAKRNITAPVVSQ